MKALSFTALTILIYLALVNLFSPAAAGSFIASGSSIASGSGVESAPATGYESPAALLPGMSNEAEAEPTRAAVQPGVVTVDPSAAAPTPAVTGLLDEAVATVRVPLEFRVAETQSPELDAFAGSVVNGQPGLVVGVYVPGTLALPVTQQPQGDPNFVSTEDNMLTQFSTASAYGAVGLLAHNYLSGRMFFNLNNNQDVILIYGDGQQQAYRIKHIQRFQALDPTNAYSQFIDVDDPSQAVISASTLFGEIYTNPNQLVFQTCIEASGDYSWGRLFVTAEKVDEK